MRYGIQSNLVIGIGKNSEGKTENQDLNDIQYVNLRLLETFKISLQYL